MKGLFMFDSLVISALCILAISFVVSYLALPRIIEIVKLKNLMDKPNERSSHAEITPTMGGLAFYMSLIFTIFLIRNYDLDNIGVNIVSAVSILFFVGLKDDLVGVNPKTKIIAQVLATLVIFFGTELQIKSLDNFLLINELPYWLSVIMSCAIMIVIVNSFNLIDGINGSASMVGIVTFVCFGYVFYLSEDYYYFLFSVLCIGFLLAFLRYNLSIVKRIFMGDTGSMIVGFMIGILILKYLSLEPSVLGKVEIQAENKIWVLLSIVFIPLFDTTRVFVTRILRNGSPFKADRSHIHHVMIDYMHLTHGKASFLLALINLVVFMFILSLSRVLSSFYLFVCLGLIFIGLALTLFYFNRSYVVRKSKRKIRNLLNSSRLSSKK